MKLHVFVIPLAALTALSACFMSDEPRIAKGAMLADGPVVFCSDPKDPCNTGTPSGDGYIITSPKEGEEDVRVRFELLAPAGGALMAAVPVYLGEMELRDEGESQWMYVVAKPVSAGEDGVSRFQVAAPACQEVPDSETQRYGLTRIDSYTCVVADLEGFRTYLIDTYPEKFDDPDWWTEPN